MRKQHQTTPEREGIELMPEAWKRTEEAIRAIAAHRPIHRQAGELVGADRPKSGRGRPRKKHRAF